MFEGIELFTLLVDDVNVSLAFYVDVLGFTIRTRRGDYVEIATVGSRVALFPRAAFGRLLGEEAGARIYVGSSVTLALRCENDRALDAAYATILNRGARVIKPPATMPWGQRAAFVADPDGNIIEVFTDAPARRPSIPPSPS